MKFLCRALKFSHRSPDHCNMRLYNHLQGETSLLTKINDEYYLYGPFDLRYEPADSLWIVGDVMSNKEYTIKSDFDDAVSWCAAKVTAKRRLKA